MGKIVVIENNACKDVVVCYDECINQRNEGRDMTLDKFTEMYLDWINNFLTVEGFAEYYEISVEQAQEIIGSEARRLDIGRKIDRLELKHVLY